ncbi:MAG: FkbM family methyltransferase [Alphaproteobacteria bacterium]|nr:MAG: FkbM family methyltransferase [Alphaproteobacteria bacterium]
MFLLSRMLKPLARALLVSGDRTRIRWGVCQGSFLPYSIASEYISMIIGRYEPEIESKLAELCGDVQVAYDLGAHVGFLSLVLARSLPDEGGEVHAFEPSPPELAKLRELVACNDLADRLRVHEIAVCDTVGKLSFNMGSGSTTGILDKVSKPRHRENRQAIEVEATTLDEFVGREGIRPPDVIKVDVEGAEATVMKGASKVLSELRPKLVVEVHGPNPCRDTIEVLLQHSYQVSLLSDQQAEVTEPDSLRHLFKKGKWTYHLVALPS